MKVQIYVIPVDQSVCDILVRLTPGTGKSIEEFSKEFFRNGTKIRLVKFILGTALAFSIPFSYLADAKERYSMTYLSYGSYDKQLEYVALSKQSFSVISPSYFNILSDGGLSVEPISNSYVEAMHRQNVKIVPFLSNHWDRTAGSLALNDVETLATQVANAVEQYGLDGINVDIENVTHQYREAYTRLVTLLRQKIPAWKEVSVAVAANPEGWNTGWHGSYDYKALGKVADHIFIMAYDEHFNGGEAGPVASIDFVEKSIRYALQYVPKEKIVLGVPFFGRIWSDNNSIKGIGITNRQIQSALEKTGGTSRIDQTSKSAVGRFTVKQSDEITVNGQKLKPGGYTIWYDNSDTLKYKLSLVDKYNLKGAGSWSVGQETPDVWDYYSLWLNGKYFSDTFSHFAKDDIVEVANHGWMVGISEHKFLPEDGLTRGQAATMLCRYLDLSDKPSDTNVSDISDHWAEKDIKTVLAHNLMIGYPDKTFRPNRAVTREEMAVILQRILKYDKSTADVNHGFSDVSEERWSYDEITAMLQSGILSGYPDNTFRPEQYLSRGEMAHLLSKAHKHSK
ncbi:MAG: S-layer homology domain-containing protein [Clostridia bacterium]|nr:S-layer homology domain-containing protein [Clostridia bacterium]